MRVFLKIFGGIILLSIVLIGALFLVTSGEYSVRQLVTEDASLPSETVAGTKLHLRVTDGPSGAPTIIVLHGGPGADFRSLQGLDALSDSYRLVYYDQRGAGLSERVAPAALSLSGYIDELDAVIDLMSPETPPILIGHSWGAILATAYLGQFPERVRHAVLMEPGFLDNAGYQSWKEESQTYMSGLPYWRDAMLTGFRAQHVDAVDPDTADDFLIGHMVDVFANHPKNPYHCGAGYTAPHWRFGARSSQAMDQFDPNVLDGIAFHAQYFEGPVLLMAGACNTWTGEALQRQHASFFRNADLVMIEEAGHNVIWDNPTSTIAMIRAFIEKAP